MVRNKLAVAIAALGALQANVAGALGLGEFSLNSALNQPLSASIKLLNTSDLDGSQVRIALASSGDFQDAGVSRDYFLTNFKFTVEMDGQGGGVIKVSTREPVIEPYLDFLIEARWPNGRMLREYTVLLDLPVFSESAGAPVVSASSASQPAAVEQAVPEPVRSVTAVASTRSVASSPVAKTPSTLQPGEQYRVSNEDTLWEIASKSRPSTNVTVQQTMLGIQRNNPSAFVNGNINRLKAGSVLRLPTMAEVTGISERDAVGEVASQNRAWRTGVDQEPVAQAQLDATARAANTRSPVTEQPRLSIAAVGDSDQTRVGDGSGSGSGTQALENELAASQESLDKIERDNSELQSRLDDMESKMATLQRLLELKDDQLAALQGEIASSEDTQPAVAGEDTVADTLETEVVGAEEAAVAETETAAPDAEVVVADTETAALAGQEPASQPKPRPAPPAAEPELLDQLLANPLYTGGAGLLAIALLILLLRRRKSAEDEVEPVADLMEDPEEVLADLEFNEVDEDVAEQEQQQPELDISDQLAAELEQEISADAAKDQQLDADSGHDPQSVATVESETGDAIAEADIYVAYGRFPQAIDLLRSAIAQEPQRSDLQVKLLEVYIETRDKPAFQQQFVELRALADEAAVAEVKDMLSSVDGVADWLEDMPGAATDFTNAGMDAELIDGVGDELDSAQEPELEDEEEIELDFDLELDDSGDDSETVVLDGDEVELDQELDFDLEDSADSISQNKTMQFDAVNPSEALADEELDLSLDEDLGLEQGFDLDLNEAIQDDIELDGADDAELEALATDSASDQEFDLDLDEVGELDLELGDLNEADLDDLEVEFGELDSSAEAELQPGLDETLADDELILDGELELPQEVTSSDAVELAADNDLSAQGDQPGQVATDDLSAEVFEFTAEDASKAVADESFDEAETSAAGDDDFDFLADTDEVATKLDLARAYIDMGDTEGAKDILDEVNQEGTDEQKQEASNLMERVV